MIIDDSHVLHTSNLAKSYEVGDSVFYALHPTDFALSQGSLTCISGASGSGKTTLLSLLGLLDNPSEGTVFVRGTDTRTMSDSELSQIRAENFGFVFQAFHLIGERTSLQNVALGGQYSKQVETNLYHSAQEKLEMVGLEHRVNAKTQTLSGGEKQRVAIARALMNQPAVLFCDEPTGNLDSGNTENIMRLLKQLTQEEPISILMVTHNLELLQFADEHYSMKDGRLA